MAEMTNDNDERTLQMLNSIGIFRENSSKEH